MTTSKHNQAFAELVRGATERQPRVLKNYKKVRAALKAYAEQRGLPLAELSLVHICHDRNRAELSPSLAAFIERLSGTRNYKSEVRSRLRSILKALSSPEDEQSAAAPKPLPMPEVLRKVLPVLPRQNTGMAKGKMWIPYKDEERRLAQPLTEGGHQLLIALIHVVEEHGITDLDALMTTHRAEIQRAIRRMLPPRTWVQTSTILVYVQRALGYAGRCSQVRCIDPPHWPPTLRKQFEYFLELAPRGIDHDLALIKRAAEHGVKVVPLKESTIKRYQKALSIGLGYILPRLANRQSDPDVRDLMRIRKEPREGHEPQPPRDINPLIEPYRRHERERVTRAKRAGFDSATFTIFTAAVKAVAAFNGYFDLHESFNAAYTLNPDVTLRKSNKTAKKEIFDLPWIDSEIARMLVEFRRIVKEQSFKFATHEKATHAMWRSARDMRFCLFFVILVTLRYMGHRQQTLRNCEIGRGKNVEFGADGSIHFNWKAKLIKNDWELDQVLKEWEHQTHELMLEVLTNYYKVIYCPYILKNSAVDPEGRSLVANQLFVHIDRDGKFRRFHADGFADFGTRFKYWSLEFMNFDGRANIFGRGLHPHFFRGLAVDWMVNKRKVPFDKAADFFGITVKTLVYHYLRADPKKSAESALEAANAEQKAKAAKAKEEELQKRMDERELAHKEELARKDDLLEKKDQRIYELQDQLIAALKKAA